jgi:hypothetical protein
MLTLRSIMSATTIAAIYMTTQPIGLTRATGFAISIFTNLYFIVDRMRANDKQMTMMYVVFTVLSVLGVYNNL